MVEYGGVPSSVSSCRHRATMSTSQSSSGAPPSLANGRIHRRSESLASIEELTGIKFDPPPPEEEDDSSYWFKCRWFPSRRILKSIAPAELKEVGAGMLGRRHSVQLLIVCARLSWLCLVAGGVPVAAGGVPDLLHPTMSLRCLHRLAYSPAAQGAVETADADHRAGGEVAPPEHCTCEQSSLTPSAQLMGSVSQEALASPLVLPQVVCQENVLDLSYALQSPYSEGFVLPDGTRPDYRALAEVRKAMAPHPTTHSHNYTSLTRSPTHSLAHSLTHSYTSPISLARSLALGDQPPVMACGTAAGAELPSSEAAGVYLGAVPGHGGAQHQRPADPAPDDHGLRLHPPVPQPDGAHEAARAPRRLHHPHRHDAGV